MRKLLFTFILMIVGVTFTMAQQLDKSATMTREQRMAQNSKRHKDGAGRDAVARKVKQAKKIDRSTRRSKSAKNRRSRK